MRTREKKTRQYTYRMKRLLYLILLLNISSTALPKDLPTFGDSSSGIISMNQERKLGQQFLRSI